MRAIILVCAAFAISGCDYVPRKIYKIATTDGHVLLLSCPMIDASRNEVTYLIDGECVLVQP